LPSGRGSVRAGDGGFARWITMGRGALERALAGRIGIGLSPGAGFGNPRANTGSSADGWGDGAASATGGS